jgi:hypothetical protein
LSSAWKKKNKRESHFETNHVTFIGTWFQRIVARGGASYVCVYKRDANAAFAGAAAPLRTGDRA